jgi:AcrR family transcriptional regulator
MSPDVSVPDASLADTPPDRAYHHGDLKRALVEAGVAILEEEGLDALSLRAIAARVGVSHAAPRNHFGSLQGLRTAIAAEAFRRHAAFMREGVGEGGAPEARLRAAMKGYVRFAVRHPALFDLMFSATLRDGADADFQAAAEGSYAVLADVARGLDWDRADEPAPQLRAEMMLWSLAHGFAALRRSGHFGPAPFGVADVAPAFGCRPRP